MAIEKGRDPQKRAETTFVHLSKDAKGHKNPRKNASRYLTNEEYCRILLTSIK